MKSHSQAFQDLFVLAVLNQKRDGTFLDVGCFDPKEGNNTYLLEKEYGWTGVSLDQQDCDHAERKGIFVKCDATKMYPQAVFDATGHHLDYLSLDVDEDTNNALPVALAFAKYSVITVEHDLYARGIEQQQQQRDMIRKCGYVLRVPNVYFPGRPDMIFEDWYTAPEVDCPAFTAPAHDAKKVVEMLWRYYFEEDVPV